MNCCELSLCKKHTATVSLTQQTPNYVAELTLAPSEDEILPVRSQELADQCPPDENKLTKIASVPLGMEYTLPTQN